MKKKTIPTSVWIAVTCASLAFACHAHWERNKLSAELKQRNGATNLTVENTPIKTAHRRALTQTETNGLNRLSTPSTENSPQQTALQEEPPENRNATPRESWESRMARMKEEDPEGYAERVKQRQERHEQVKYSLAEKTASFMEMDTRFMTDQELENHNLLISKMAKIFELTNTFNDPEAPPDREAMRELFSELNEARPLMDQERSVMFRQVANELGFTDDDSAAFVNYLEDIIEITTLQPPRGRGGFGGAERR
jgi:hypothetical protein